MFNPLKSSGHYMYRTVVTICPASLTFNNSTFCPHSVFMCFVGIWEQTAIISLYNFNWLVCITETDCAYCAVRTKSLVQLRICSVLYFNSANPQYNFGSLHTLYLCCSYLLYPIQCLTLKMLHCLFRTTTDPPTISCCSPRTKIQFPHVLTQTPSAQFVP